MSDLDKAIEVWVSKIDHSVLIYTSEKTIAVNDNSPDYAKVLFDLAEDWVETENIDEQYVEFVRS